MEGIVQKFVIIYELLLLLVQIYHMNIIIRQRHNTQSEMGQVK